MVKYLVATAEKWAGPPDVHPETLQRSSGYARADKGSSACIKGLPVSRSDAGCRTLTVNHARTACPSRG